MRVPAGRSRPFNGAKRNGIGFGKGETTVKTKEELTALKEEVETLNKKLAELSEEELAQVSGGQLQEIEDEDPLWEL